jgi:hypothetical protein
MVPQLLDCRKGDATQLPRPDRRAHRRWGMQGLFRCLSRNLRLVSAPGCDSYPPGGESRQSLPQRPLKAGR